MAKRPTGTYKKLTPEQQTAFDAALKDWRAADEAKAAAIAKEEETRSALLDMVFKEPAEGTNTFEIDAGQSLKCDMPIYRKVVPAQLESLQAWLAAERSTDGVPSNRASLLQSIIDRCVRYKPEVVVSEYKELAAEDKKLMADVFEEKPGKPSLKLHLAKKA